MTALPHKIASPNGYDFSEAQINAVMQSIYASGDRMMKLFILVHCIIAFCLAFFYGTWLITLTVGGAAALMFFASVALMPRSFLTRCIAGVSLQAFVALHIYQLHGLPEMHFFFFTAFTMMIVYKDWKSMWPGTLLIIGQHILFAALSNMGYNLNFFASGITFTKLFFHFGIALAHVGLCGYWAKLLRERALTDAFQQEELSRKQALLEVQMAKAKEANAALADQKMQLESLNRQLQALAITDGLTGLNNHRAFQDEFTKEYRHAARYQTPLSLILMDVDHFKEYNDSYGHPAGDEILKKLADLLAKGARESDIVARYGGEEFVIILPNTDQIGALMTAERLRHAILTTEWGPRPVTASFGVATLTLATQTRAQLIADADAALYAAKRQDRNCVARMTDGMIAPVA